MGHRRNLILISRPHVNSAEDFERLGRMVQEADRDIRPAVMFDRPLRRPALLQRWRLASAPTLVFSPVRCKRFRAPRGTVCEGTAFTKIDERRALIERNIATPQYEYVTENRRPDLSHLGEYVVVKPDRGGRGANVRVMRHSRVRWEPQNTRVSGAAGAILVERFVYTGQWPVNYRVTTLFGQVLWALRQEADRSRTPLESADAFRRAGGVSIVASSRGCTMSLCDDPEVIRFGEAAHAAFPEQPLLGVDVVREQPSGKLYVLEVNSSGYVWHFSSPLGLKLQRDFGFSLESQFDGIRKAARILAQVTRERAT